MSNEYNDEDSEEYLVSGVDWWGRDDTTGDWSMVRKVDPTLLHLYPRSSLRVRRDDETGESELVCWDRAVRYSGAVSIYLN